MSIVRRKILLTGKNGQVGWELERSLQPLGQVIAFDHTGMDLANPDSIRSVIREVKPDLIVNPAAYTAVDKAESEPDLAMAVNGVAPGIIAEEAKRLGAALIHYSTDYVFGGTKVGPYTEDDMPNPINVYGKTKLAGEQAVQAIGVPYMIFRTSWVYGMRGKNFLLTILRMAKEKDELRIVDDQFGAPTWSRMIAETTAQILAQYYSSISYRSTFPRTDFNDIYHVTAGGRATWYEFAKAILEDVLSGVLSRLTEEERFAQWPHGLPNLTPITTEEYQLPAKRPFNSVLSNHKLNSHFGLALPNWSTSLTLCADELYKGFV